MVDVEGAKPGIEYASNQCHCSMWEQTIEVMMFCARIRRVSALRSSPASSIYILAASSLIFHFFSRT